MSEQYERVSFIDPDAMRQYTEGRLPQASMTISGFYDADSFSPLPIGKPTQVHIAVPASRWQAIKGSWSILRWLKKLRPVRYREVLAFEGVMEYIGDGEITVTRRTTQLDTVTSTEA